jgi:hypothetical protein
MLLELGCHRVSKWGGDVTGNLKMLAIVMTE